MKGGEGCSQGPDGGGKGSRAGRKETGLLKSKVGRVFCLPGGGGERKGALDTVDYREERKSQHLKKNKRW
jgi:hypothetical protein